MTICFIDLTMTIETTSKFRLNIFHQIKIKIKIKSNQKQTFSLRAFLRKKTLHGLQTMTP